MQTIRLFLASSAELKEDRTALELFVNRRNKDWVPRGVFLELVIWEDFLDALSRTRLQDEYNRAIRGCDLFVMLFWTKVGCYTREEFETAFGQFQAARRPLIYTWFKDAPSASGAPDPAGRQSLLDFQARLTALGHFQTRYRNIEDLLLQLGRQLDLLAAQGFIPLDPGGDAAASAAPGTVKVIRDNTGIINTGTLIQTGGGAYIGGNVSVTGGDFVGRDRIDRTKD